MEKRASAAAVRRILSKGGRGSWAGFKHALMRDQGVPAGDFYKWSVPQIWIKAYKAAHK